MGYRWWEWCWGVSLKLKAHQTHGSKADQFTTKLNHMIHSSQSTLKVKKVEMMKTTSYIEKIRWWLVFELKQALYSTSFIINSFHFYTFIIPITNAHPLSILIFTSLLLLDIYSKELLQFYNIFIKLRGVHT